MLPFMWEAFLDVISLLDENAVTLVPILHIELEESKSLDTVVPDLSQLDLLLSSELPSIYVGKRLSLSVREYEGYQIPLQQIPPFATPDPNVNFFFRCARSADAMRRGWEFSRTIDAEYCPASLRKA